MFWPYGVIHPPTVRAVLGLFRRKPSGHVLTKSDRCICPVLCHVFLTQSSASVGLSQNLQRNLHVAPCVTSLRKRPPKLPKRNDTNQRHEKRFSQNLIVGNLSKPTVCYEQSPFFLSPSSDTRKTRKWPCMWLKVWYGRASFLARSRALPSLNYYSVVIEYCRGYWTVVWALKWLSYN